MSQRWVVFGGKSPAFTSHGDLYIPCGRSSPPLPLAIECISTDEAELVMQTLKTVLGPLLPETTTQELLDVLKAAVCAGSSFHWQNGNGPTPFAKAMMWMVAKGVEDQIPPLITKLSVVADSSDGDADELVNMFNDALRVETSGPSARASTASHSATANPLFWPWITKSRYYFAGNTVIEIYSEKLGAHCVTISSAHGYTHGLAMSEDNILSCSSQYMLGTKCEGQCTELPRTMYETPNTNTKLQSPKRKTPKSETQNSQSKV
ncbi:hypothetical protein BKA82DRAFT_29848 [Pisolithus tinctorius]|nr:hypothetical protein BKA82DRAFT_29848 [Pisolithus tinctorius]